MKIINNKLEAEAGDPKISFKETPNFKGKFGTNLPDTIVIHYTGGASLESSVSWLTNPAAQASAHLVVGKTGEIVQLVPFDTIAWHAGRSSWKGRTFLNHFSIGIELDNAGLLKKRVDGYYTDFNRKIEEKNVVLAKHKQKTETEAWEAYTSEQLESAEKICTVLIKQYKINEMVGHEDIAPGRKIDPGPAFPLQSFRDKILFGRSGGEPEDTQLTTKQLGIVMADYLNIRDKDSIQAHTVTDPLPRGTRLQIIESKGEWAHVKIDVEGWVNNKWIKIIE